jgi:nucleoside-diphosphate-sugar epimerase
MKDGALSALIVAAGASNSRLSEGEVSNELKRFHSFVEKCEFSKYSRVVFISSGGSVYGEDFSQMIYEETSENPQTPYGRLKID